MKKKRKPSGQTPFANILRSIMDERGLTIRKVAGMAGVSPSTIDDWRGGALPQDFSAVKKLSKELGISFSLLLTGEADERDINQLPAIAEVFSDGGPLFDGYAKITIQRLIPRKKDEK